MSRFQRFSVTAIRFAISLVLAFFAIPSEGMAQSLPDPGEGLHTFSKGLFQIGVGVPVGIADRRDDWPLLRQHYGIMTPENCMKPAAVQPVEGEFEFDSCDRFVNLFRQMKLQVVGHCLVWAKDDRTPDWWKTGPDGEPVSRELLLKRMEKHIRKLAGRYGDRIAMWDVVNEALDDGDDTYLRDSVWSRTTGEEFMVRAFQVAREEAPNALLIYNDYRCDTAGKRDKLIRLIRSLKQQGAPIDAVGLQGHYELDSIPLEGLEAMFVALRDLQVKVVVSELDIDVVQRGKWWAEDGRFREELKSYDPYKEGCPPEILKRQADQYGQLFQLFCKYSDVIERVSFWNLTDGQSWLNYFPWDRTNHPLLFDRQRRPKPAYHAVVRVLREANPAIQQGNRNPAGLHFQEMATQAVPGWQKANHEGQDYWLNPSSLVDGADIVSFQYNPADSGNGELEILFSESAGEKLGSYTRAHQGERLAIVFDGRILSAPRIQGLIKRRASLSGLRVEEQLEQILDSLHRESTEGHQ